MKFLQRQSGELQAKEKATVRKREREEIMFVYWAETGTLSLLFESHGDDDDDKALHFVAAKETVDD